MPATPTMDRVAWLPQPGPQTALVACPLEDVGFGGAKGGGKTDGLIGDWLGHADRYGKGARGIFFRRTYDELSEVMERCEEIFPSLGARWSVGSKTWRFPNGARLKLRYLETDADAERYEGHQYTWEGFDEVGDWPSPTPIDRLRSRLRSKLGVPCFSRLTFNPGGRGHTWIKARYVTPAPAMTPFFDAEKKVNRVFIPSRLKDNRILVTNDPEYTRRLHGAGTKRQVEAWLNGDWSDDLDGGLFQTSLIQRLDMTAAQAIKKLGLRPSSYWDLATREKQLIKLDPNDEPDYSVGAVVARDELDRWIILHVWRGQVRSDQLLRQMHSISQRFQCPVKAEKGGIEKTLQGVLPMMNSIIGTDLAILPLGKGSIDKVQHSIPLQMLVNSGNVYVVADAPWFPDLEAELKVFPKIGVKIHDDQVDALSYAAHDTKRQPKAKPAITHPNIGRDLTAADAERIMDVAKKLKGQEDSGARWW